VIDESGAIYQGTVEMDDVTGKASITLSGVAAKPKSIRYPRHTIPRHLTVDHDLTSMAALSTANNQTGSTPSRRSCIRWT
jgi:hypothetical protein